MDNKLVIVVLAIFAAVQVLVLMGPSLLRSPDCTVTTSNHQHSMAATTVQPSDTTSSSPRTIYLIGERHSGTKWITGELERCFKDTGVQVSNHFSRRKHWFQKNGTFYHDENAVVVMQVRNVYDWTHGMWEYPHHSPAHFHLDWKTFVTSPWTLPGAPRPAPEDWTATEPPCVESSRPDEVVPCHILMDRQVITYYELRPKDGLVYPSVIYLRRDKLLNHASVASFVNVSSFTIVRLEDMVQAGTAPLIRKLEQVLGVQARCEPSVGRPIVRKKLLDRDMVAWLNQHVDWNVESMFGYKPFVFENTTATNETR